MVNRKYPSSQRGYTLLEMAIVVLIFGLLTAAILELIKPVLRKEKLDVTRENMIKIEQAFAEYARNRGTLPCPALPANAARGQAPLNCPTPASREGVVPFANIGLTERDSTDGWGNPFTYVVSQAANTAQVAPTVHANCRTNAWIDSVSNLNNNPIKARFCCRDARFSLEVSVDMNPLSVGIDSPTQTQAAAVSDPLLEPTEFDPNINLVAATVPRELGYIAYAVISHGANGEGPFVWGQAARRLLQKPADANEQENRTANDTVMDPLALNAVAFGSKIEATRTAETNFNAGYDDIVLWRTQRQMIASNGMDSCNIP